MRIPKEMLDILVCPVTHCRSPLEQVRDRLVCGGCGASYVVEHGWAVLIPEQAERHDDRSNCQPA